MTHYIFLSYIVILHYMMFTSPRMQAGMLAGRHTFGVARGDVRRRELM